MADRSSASELRAQARDRRRREADTRQTDGADDVKSAAREAASAAAYGATVAAGQALTQGAESESRRPAAEPSSRGDGVAGAKPNEVKAAVAHARDQLEAVQGRPVESVSGVERTRDGWVVDLEVVELSRIPETTDVLATYEVVLDDRGNLKRYARRRRYHRADAEERS